MQPFTEDEILEALTCALRHLGFNPDGVLCSEIAIDLLEELKPFSTEELPYYSPRHCHEAFSRVADGFATYLTSLKQGSKPLLDYATQNGITVEEQAGLRDLLNEHLELLKALDTSILSELVCRYLHKR